MIARIGFVGFLVALSSVHAEWDYNEQGEDWPEQYPQCGGMYQSPIHITTGDTIPAPRPAFFHPIRFSRNIYSKVERATLENNGYGYKIEFHDHDRVLRSNGLPGDYRLIQAHIHFGSKQGHGSEHVFDGIQYPAEIHFVFQNNDSCYQGSCYMGHLAVLAYFVTYVQYTEPIGEGLAIWLDKLNEVQNEGETVDVSGLIDLSTIIPAKMGVYYRYVGSLTTPPCNQTVLWTVFQEPIVMTYDEYKKLLNGKKANNETMINTFRMAQAINGRNVFKSSPATPFLP